MRTVSFRRESRGIKYFLEAVNPLCELFGEPGVASEEGCVAVAPVQGAGERGTLGKGTGAAPGRWREQREEGGRGRRGELGLPGAGAEPREPEHGGRGGRRGRR